MTAYEAIVGAVVVVLVLGAGLLAGVAALKLAHRRRIVAHDIRRKDYLQRISLHLARPGATQALLTREVQDDAFVDAIIDIRNTVTGAAIDTLDALVNQNELIAHQAARLRSRFPLGRRLRAVVALSEIGDRRAARVLLHHLSDTEPEIRVHCAKGLARMKYTPAIEVILDKMIDEPTAVRSIFTESLIAFGPSASWPMTQYVRQRHRDGDTTGVPEVARAIGRIGEREVGSALTELLYEIEDVEISIATIDSLGLIGGPLALRPLRKMLTSEDWRIRAKAASAMGEIGDPSVNPILFAGLSDTSWWMRRNSAAALSSLPGGVKWLYDALISHDQFARDAAAEALADCGELAAAKLRMDSRSPNPKDLRLINYMDQPGMVFS